MHQIALHGWVNTAMTTYAHFISTPIRARIKLH
jgi:NADH dehydrogenase